MKRRFSLPCSGGEKRKRASLPSSAEEKPRGTRVTDEAYSDMERRKLFNRSRDSISTSFRETVACSYNAIVTVLLSV